MVATETLCPGISLSCLSLSRTHTSEKGAEANRNVKHARKNSTITPPSLPTVFPWKPSEAAGCESSCTVGRRKHLVGTQSGDSYCLLSGDTRKRPGELQTHRALQGTLQVVYPRTIHPLIQLHRALLFFWNKIWAETVRRGLEKEEAINSEDEVKRHVFILKWKKAIRAAPQWVCLCTGDCLRGTVYAYLILEWAAIILSSKYGKQSGRMRELSDKFSFDHPCSSVAILFY